MKRLTINRVARANLKFHRKAYISLLTGIFLAVYLVSATGMCLWGMFQAREAQMARQVGWLERHPAGQSPGVRRSAAGQRPV